MIKKLKQVSKAWYFLILVILFYISLFLINSELFFLSLNSFSKILIKILPIFVFVFILMFLTNLFVKRKFIIEHLKKRGIKKWFFVIVGGILSSGPIYMWYPLLAELKSRGLNYGFITCFLYNRAIKIPLIPVAILYFGWRFVLILSLVMVIASVFQGMVVNKVMEKK